MIISKSRRIAVGLTTLALTAAGLATPASAGAAAHMPKYTLSDSGKTVTVEKSHKIKIDLRTDRDGGYSWKIKTQSGTHTMSVVRRTVRPYKHKPGTVGFPYHTIYILKAVNARQGHGQVRRAAAVRQVQRRQAVQAAHPRAALAATR